MLTKEELDRYNRQIILPDFGIEAQGEIKKAFIGIIGWWVGGLGSCFYILLHSGIGRIGFN